MKEIWKTCTYPLVEPNRYKISSIGRVQNIITGKILMPYQLPCLYYVIKLKSRFIIKDEIKNKYTNFYIHKLVAWEFCEYKSGKTEVNHKNGDKTDNEYTNLEWVTPGENTRHAFETGLVNIYGENNHSNVYSEEMVRNICRQFESGLTKSEILKNITKNPNAKSRDYTKLYALLVHIHNKDRFTWICNEYNYEPVMKINENDPIVIFLRDGYENIDIMKHYGYNSSTENTALYSKILETRKQLMKVQRLSKT